MAGYFVWCRFDTFERIYGYRPCFGLVRVACPALMRVPKASAGRRRELIGRSAPCVG